MGELAGKREAFAQALLKNLISGDFKYRGDAALAAAKAAGYRGSALKDNARKWANEADVKARMTEIAAPVKPEVEPELLMEIGEAKQTLAMIARNCKPADRIQSIRQLCLMEGWEAPTRHEHTGKNGEPLFDLSKLSDDQLAAVEAILAAAALGDPGGAELSQAEGKPH